jgi:hypothetical protein
MRPWRPPQLPAVGDAAPSIHLPEGDLQEDDVRWHPCYRVIASEYAGENLFDRLVDAKDLEAVQQIADLTNPVILDRLGEIELVPMADRIYGPGTGLIMAAFAFPTGPSRFAKGDRGTYYATKDRETAIAESRHHATNSLTGSGPCTLAKTVIEAALDAILVDIRQGRPAPRDIYDDRDYSTAQAFGELVRNLNGDGIVYDSVRHPGECVAIFRAWVLRKAQAAQTLMFEWNGNEIVSVH